MGSRTGPRRARLRASDASPARRHHTSSTTWGRSYTEEIRGYSEEFLTHASDPRGREIIERVCRYWVSLFADRRENPRGDFDGAGRG
ncbi:hypothetical protein HBB16_03940 [Pseudonocardia sp. MCCB 268]|nr:hypothetical protein [Pseudonocardia cytotoxica]